MSRCRPRKSLATAVLCLSLFSCSLHEVRDDYPTGIEMPDSFSSSGGQPAPAECWWESFGDPGLNDTVEQVLRDNPGLMQFWARLRQVEAAARQAGSLLLPEVSAEGAASRARASAPAAGGEDRQVTRNQYLVALAAGYEVDLWKRLEHLHQAAALNYEATSEDLQAAAMTLAAVSVETWFAAVEQNAQLQLLEEQMKTGETFLSLLELRFALGQATALDLYQQRQQLAATKSQFPLVEIQRRFLEHRLASLAGVPPGGAGPVERASFPDIPPYPDPGIPVNVLHRRPDVRSAFLRVKAADHGVAAAIAELLPSLRLSARAGFQAAELGDLFSTIIYQLAAGALGPVYDGGRREAEVLKRKEELEERLHGYREKIVEALREVEDALAGERKQAEYLRSLEEQMKIGRATLEQARLRYASGLSDYLPVLTALQALQRLERSYLSSRRQRYSYRIQLYRALGGSWVGLPVPPSVRGHAEVKGE